MDHFPQSYLTGGASRSSSQSGRPPRHEANAPVPPRLPPPQPQPPRPNEEDASLQGNNWPPYVHTQRNSFPHSEANGMFGADIGNQAYGLRRAASDTIVQISQLQPPPLQYQYTSWSHDLRFEVGNDATMTRTIQPTFASASALSSPPSRAQQTASSEIVFSPAPIKRRLQFSPIGTADSQMDLLEDQQLPDVVRRPSLMDDEVFSHAESLYVKKQGSRARSGSSRNASLPVKKRKKVVHIDNENTNVDVPTTPSTKSPHNPSAKSKPKAKPKPNLESKAKPKTKTKPKPKVQPKSKAKAPPKSKTTQPRVNPKSVGSPKHRSDTFVPIDQPYPYHLLHGQRSQTSLVQDVYNTHTGHTRNPSLPPGWPVQRSRHSFQGYGGRPPLYAHRQNDQSNAHSSSYIQPLYTGYDHRGRYPHHHSLPSLPSLPIRTPATRESGLYRGSTGTSASPVGDGQPTDFEGRQFFYVDVNIFQTSRQPAQSRCGQYSPETGHVQREPCRHESPVQTMTPGNAQDAFRGMAPSFMAAAEASEDSTQKIANSIFGNPDFLQKNQPESRMLHSSQQLDPILRRSPTAATSPIPPSSVTFDDGETTSNGLPKRQGRQMSRNFDGPRTSDVSPHVPLENAMMKDPPPNTLDNETVRTPERLASPASASSPSDNEEVARLASQALRGSNTIVTGHKNKGGKSVNTLTMLRINEGMKAKKSEARLPQPFSLSQESQPVEEVPLPSPSPFKPLPWPSPESTLRTAPSAQASNPAQLLSQSQSPEFSVDMSSVFEGIRKHPRSRQMTPSGVMLVRSHTPAIESARLERIQERGPLFSSPPNSSRSQSDSAVESHTPETKQLQTSGRSPPETDLSSMIGSPPASPAMTSKEDLAQEKDGTANADSSRMRVAGSNESRAGIPTTDIARSTTPTEISRPLAENEPRQSVEILDLHRDSPAFSVDMSSVFASPAVSPAKFTRSVPGREATTPLGSIRRTGCNPTKELADDANVEHTKNALQKTSNQNQEEVSINSSSEKTRVLSSSTSTPTSTSNTGIINESSTPDGQRTRAMAKNDSEEVVVDVGSALTSVERCTPQAKRPNEDSPAPDSLNMPILGPSDEERGNFTIKRRTHI